MAALNTNKTGISTYHLSKNPQLYEPARSNAFEFLISPNVTQLLEAGVDSSIAEDADYLQNIQETIKIAVDESSVPHFDLNTLEIKRGNSTMKFAGTPTFSDHNLKCIDYVGARVKDILLAWQALAYNVTADVVELAGNYKYDCELVEYSPDFSKIIRKWTLIGCWVKAISESNFSHESANDKRTIDVTIVYDRAIPSTEK